MRDVRWLFLLKLVLAARAGIDREPMIRAQRDMLAPSVAALEERLGTGSEAEDIYAPLPPRHDTVRSCTSSTTCSRVGRGYFPIITSVALTRTFT